MGLTGPSLNVMSQTISYAFNAHTLHGKVVGGVLATVGVILLLVPEGVVSDGLLIGVVMIALGGGVLLMTARTARDKRAHLVVDDEGIWYRDWGLDVIPWDEIDRVYVRGLRFKIMVCVELKDPEGFVATMSPANRSRLGSNPLIQLPVLRLPPKVLDATMDELMTALQSGLEA